MKNNYSRRKFMKTVVVSAGAMGAGGMAGCGSDSFNSSEDTSITLTTPSSFDTFGTTFPQSVASGDPRHKSIILWTRVGGLVGPATLTLQVATDAEFSSGVLESEVVAEANADHCVKVKVTDLTPYTRYYYRFLYEGKASNTGRFKTAPIGTDSKDVKFGFVSCQDYSNGYYNTLLKFLETANDDLDFIVHLGDYIYETEASSVRTVAFTDQTDAVQTNGVNAAATVNQYRDLYKTYRTDKVLQKLHELFPFICIWDDHEFSDDSWRDNATYKCGLPVATGLDNNTARKRNAEQAFFEYMPIDISPLTGNILTEGQQSVSASELYSETRPGSIYRGIRYGQNLNLVMTDFRSFRPDHAIPEDAYPGTVVMTQYQVGQVLYQNNRFGVVSTVKGAGGTLPLPYNPASTAAQELSSDEPYPWADSSRVTSADQTLITNAVSGLVQNGTLPLLPYIDIDAVTNSNFLNFIATLDGVFRAIGTAIPASGLSGFLTTAGVPVFREFLIMILTQAYQNSTTMGSTDKVLSPSEALAKAIATASGNQNVNALNATLVGFYDATLIQAAPLLAGIGIVIDVTTSPDGTLTQARRDAAFTTLASAPALGSPAGLALTRIFPDASVPSDDDNPASCTTATVGSTHPNYPNAAVAELAELTTDTSWGFRGFGIPWALLGKQSLASSIGARYLVVKDTYDLYSGYILTAFTDYYRSIEHLKISDAVQAIDNDARSEARAAADKAAAAVINELEDGRYKGFGNPWGDNQQTSVLVQLTTSSATWNILGSSVSFTSLILDYKTDYTAFGYPLDLRSAVVNAGLEQCIESPTDDKETSTGVLPETRFYMNVDHWDGFPQTRTTYMNNSTYNLPTGIGSFQDTNTVIISGDIHSSFITEHGSNDNGRCFEFTVPAVSSTSFADFTKSQLGALLGVDVTSPPFDSLVQGLVNNLGLFLQQGAVGEATVGDQPQEIKYANPLQHGVGIMNVTASQLTGSIHHLPTNTTPAFLSEAFSNYQSFINTSEFRSAADSLSGNFVTTSYTSTKEGGSKKNGALT